MMGKPPRNRLATSHRGVGLPTTAGTEPTRIRRRSVSYKAEYIWIDGTEPRARLRSKTKVLEDGKALPIWGFDGSRTNQAPGSNSDCVLQPVASYADPIRGGD